MGSNIGSKPHLIAHSKDRVQLKISGKFHIIEKQQSCFTTFDVDAERIGELINACGYTVSSVSGRKLTIKIEEEI